MLRLIVAALEILVLVLIIVSFVKRAMRDDRKPLARPIVHSRQHDKPEASVGEQVVALPAEPQVVAATIPTQQAKAVPTGRATNIRRGRKILHLEELARGDEIVTRVSRLNQDGKRLGQQKEQQMPLEEAVKTLVKG